MTNKIQQTPLGDSSNRNERSLKTQKKKKNLRFNKTNSVTPNKHNIPKNMISYVPNKM